MLLKLCKFSNGVKNNRVYVLMLLFIGLLNMTVRFMPGAAEYNQQKKQILEAQQLRIDTEIKERERAIAVNINQNESLQRVAAALTFLFAFMLLTGAAFLITFIKLRIKGRQPLSRTLSAPLPEWDLSDVVRVAVIFIFFSHVFFLIESILADFFGIKIADSSVKLILSAVLLDLTALGFSLYFIMVKFGQRLAAIGLAVRDFLHNIVLGIAGYLAFLPALLGVVFISYLLGEYFHIKPQNQPFFELLMKEERLSVLVILSIFIGVIGPFIEEIFFRGFFYSALKKKLNAGLSMFLVSAVFAALHMNILGFLPIFSLSFVLVYMFDKTGSLVPSILIHCIHNCMIIAFLFLSRFFAGNF